MAGWTNRGKFNVFGHFFRNVAAPTDFRAMLCTSIAAPTADTDTFAALTEIAAGNGYTSGGITLARSAVGFDVLTENDTNDRGELQLADLVWTASGGPIPSSGNGARYLVLTDDNVTINSREVLCYWDLTSDRSVTDGQALTLADFEIRLFNAAANAQWTNRGKVTVLDAYFRGAALDANLQVMLITDAVVPTADTNLFSELTEIAAGNGYVSGGGAPGDLARNATDFDVLTEDDTGDRAFTQFVDAVWTAAGGPIPASGNGARYAVLTDDNVTIGSREVYAWFDLGAARSVSDTQTITLQDMELGLTES